MNNSKARNCHKIFHGESARQKIPDDQMTIMNELINHFKVTSQKELVRISIKSTHMLYIYLSSCKWNTIAINLYTVKYEEEREQNRYLSCGVKYWKDFENPTYKGMFSIDMSVESGIDAMLDSSIWILEYVYRNNRDLFERLFSDKPERVVKWSRGTDEEYYFYYFFYPEEMEFVKEMIREIMEWLLSREEIIEVLKGERWIEGYVPPTPY